MAQKKISQINDTMSQWDDAHWVENESVIGTSKKFLMSILRKIIPIADTTTAFTVTKSDGVTNLFNVDSTNDKITATNVEVLTSVIPDSNDGATLGTSSLQFSDLYLAEGAVINFDNGDATITQTGNSIAIGGADLSLGANNLAITGSIGDTTNRVTKVWVTDIDVSNKITGSITGNADGNAGTVTNGVYTSGDQTIGGTKTFSSKITGSISGNADGNAATATNADTVDGIHETQIFHNQQPPATWKPNASITGIDLNTIKASGFYSGSTLTNAPLGSAGWWHLIHMEHTGDDRYAKQLAFPLDSAGNSSIYIRTETGNSWSSWVAIVDSSGGIATIAASAITGQVGMWTSAARPGASRLYRTDHDSGYYMTMEWNGTESRWYLKTYDPANALFYGCVANEAVKLTNTWDGWSASGAISNVVGMLAWKNYGNNHVIFDASQSLSPEGTVIDRTNPTFPWTQALNPNLMGWNGDHTYGVRVDSCRLADSATTATTSSYLDGSVQTTKQVFQGDSDTTYQSGVASFEVRAVDVDPTGTYAAGSCGIAFHRPNAFASKIILGTDNRFHFGAWSDIADNGSIVCGPLQSAYMLLQDNKASGTAGGAAAAGTNNVRTLNASTTPVYNTIYGATCTTDTFTLPAGTYRLSISAPAHYVDQHKIILAYVSGANSVFLLAGTSEYSSNASGGIQSRSFINDILTVSATTTYKVIHSIAVAKTVNGLGVPSSITNILERYTTTEIWKIS